MASRRAAEELIAAGRVSVDGKVVTRDGPAGRPRHRRDPCRRQRVIVREDVVHLALNKPNGRALDDVRRDGPALRRRLRAGAGRVRQRRLFHVGRLDVDTEGLLLLTNDGELAHRLMHPSYRVLKTYLAEVPGPVAKDVGKRLKAGIELEDGPIKVDAFRRSSAPARQGAWSRWCCTRVASTSCAGCWPRSATRCSGWCAPRSARCPGGARARSPPAATRRRPACT